MTEDGLPITQDGKTPYGNVTYADPGYQKDGKQYCSQDCASGRGCNHQNCHCGRS